MKILNKQKTHFMKKSECGSFLVKYDTVENVNTVINAILNNGNKNTPINPLPHLPEKK